MHRIIAEAVFVALYLLTGTACALNESSTVHSREVTGHSTARYTIQPIKSADARPSNSCTRKMVASIRKIPKEIGFSFIKSHGGVSNNKMLYCQNKPV
ncbi:uncharacterized protein METZ01_LOCUS342180 [marine metagenome]|uniref:Uncharacterized protein n=1 Tax=marine metagenome TaxID=408172 RepID=A0A382QV43_9ZZZZ